MVAMVRGGLLLLVVWACVSVRVPSCTCDLPREGRGGDATIGGTHGHLRREKGAVEACRGSGWQMLMMRAEAKYLVPFDRCLGLCRGGVV